MAMTADMVATVGMVGKAVGAVERTGYLEVQEVQENRASQQRIRACPCHGSASLWAYSAPWSQALCG